MGDRTEILMNEKGERIDTEGNRLDNNGNLLQSNGEERKLISDELKPDQFFLNQSALVLPPVGKKTYELKNSAISFVREKQFGGTKNENPMEHIRALEDLVGNISVEGLSQDWLCCKLFPHSLSNKALNWFNNLEPASLKTWAEAKKEFINRFFDEGKAEEIRNKISTFTQTKEETFNDTWERYNKYLKDCPHHGFSDARVVTNFFRGLDLLHKMALDSASGGNFKEQYPDKALKLIKKYTKSSSANQLMSKKEAGKGASEAESIAELKEMMGQLLKKEKKMVNVSFVEGVEYQEPRQQYHHGFNSDYTTPAQTQGAPPQHDSKIESMFQLLLEGQQKLNNDLNMKMDSMYNDLNMKMDSMYNDLNLKMDSMYNDLNERMEVVDTHMRHLDTQVAQTAEAIRRQEGVLPSKTERNPKGDVKAINTEKSGNTYDPPARKDQTTAEEDAQSEENKIESESADDAADRRPCTSTGGDCQRPTTGNDIAADRRPCTLTGGGRQKIPPGNLWPCEDDGCHPPTPEERAYNPPAPYPKDVKVYNDLLELISWKVPSVYQFRGEPCVMNILDKAYAEEIGVWDAVDLLQVECAALLKKRVPRKLKDPGCFVLNCKIGNQTFEHSLCDLGSSVNIVPLSIAKSWGKLRPAQMTLTLADRSTRHPEGLLVDIPVHIGDRYVLADFVVLKFDVEPTDSLILGRPFLATAGAVIDVKHRKIDLHLGDKIMNFKMDRVKRPTIDGQTFRVDIDQEDYERMFDPGEEGNRFIPPLHKAHPDVVYIPPWKRRMSEKHRLALSDQSGTYAVYSKGPRPP